MKKNELKNGMLLETRHGKKLLYIDGCSFSNVYFPPKKIDLISIDGDGWMSTDSYNDDFLESYCSDSEWNIEKIYICKDISFQYIITTPKGVSWELFWSRNEIEEITADEARRRLEESSGKKIKITQ